MKPKPRSAFHIFNIPEAIVRYFPFFSPKLNQAAVTKPQSLAILAA
jgi:hypothetical protein